MKRIKTRLRGFAQEEKGLALTEYLILLGLMTGGVVLSTALFGSALAQAWTGSMQVLSLPTLSASAVPAGAQTGSGNETATPPEEVVTASLPNQSGNGNGNSSNNNNSNNNNSSNNNSNNNSSANNNTNQGNSNCRGRWCRDRD